MDSFFGIGIFELIIIAIVALVVLGPERLPGAMREASKYARKARDLSNELQSQFSEELQLLDEMNPKRIVNDILGPTPPAQGTPPPAQTGKAPAPKPAATTAAAPAASAAALAAAPIPSPAATTAAVAVAPDAGQSAADNTILPPAPTEPTSVSASSPPVEEGR
jgi:sec-independent protein translocase protein TatB